MRKETRRVEGIVVQMKGKNNEKPNNNKSYFQDVTHPNTNPAEQGLAFVIGRVLRRGALRDNTVNNGCKRD